MASPGIAAFTAARPLAGRMAALTIGAISLVCQIAYAQAPAGAVESLDPAATAAMAFDLPALPLSQALEQYDARTSVSVFFPSELVAGRISHAVQGYFSPEQALRLLLEGTGLMLQSAAEQAFVLAPESGPPAVTDAAANPVPLPAPMPRSYDAVLQSTIMQTLCARPDLALGQYRLALRVRIDATGHVRQVRLLDTTGNARRDTAIVDTLQGIALGQAPADPARPFVLLVQPHANADTDAPACPVLH
jgi:hypothetical protein